MLDPGTKRTPLGQTPRTCLDLLGEAGRDYDPETRVPGASFNRRHAKIDPPGVHAINAGRRVNSRVLAPSPGGWFHEKRVSR